MLTQIEDAIVSRIQTRLDNAGKVAVQKGTEGIPQPAVYVSIEDGRFENISQTTGKATVTAYVDIIFKSLHLEDKKRRDGIYLILEGIAATLGFQKLDIEITPLKLKGFRNTTTEEIKEKGLIAFTLEAETSYYIKKVDDEAVTDLLTVGLSYYLKPGDDVADAADTITM